MTASPNASRIFASHTAPSASSYGAHCTKQLMTCLSGGAIDGSTRVGIIMSMNGRREKWPYFASSYASSSSSTDAANPIAPRRCSPGPGMAVKFGRASIARFTFPDEPRYLYWRTSSSKSAGSVPLSSRPR